MNNYRKNDDGKSRNISLPSTVPFKESQPEGNVNAFPEKVPERRGNAT